MRKVTSVGSCLLGLCLTAGPVVAQQRPLLTEDPESIGDGLILMEVGIDHAWDQTFTVSGLDGDLLRGPLLGLSFGMGPNAEIQIDGVSFSRLRISDRFDAPLSGMVDASGDTTHSFDDIVVGAKIKVVSEGARMPAIALRFATRLPNASNESGLGLDTMNFFQSLLVGKTMQAVRLVGNVGVGILSDPTRGDRQNDVLTYGFSLARAFAEGAEIVGEINGRVSTPPRHPTARDGESRDYDVRAALHTGRGAVRRRSVHRVHVGGPTCGAHRRAHLGVRELLAAVSCQKAEVRRQTAERKWWTGASIRSAGGREFDRRDTDEAARRSAVFRLLTSDRSAGSASRWESTSSRLTPTGTTFCSPRSAKRSRPNAPLWLGVCVTDTAVWAPTGWCCTRRPRRGRR